MRDEICYVTSDLHLGSGPGDPHEDFHRDEAFERWVGTLGGDGVTLVLNGDVVDFLAIEPFDVSRVPSGLLWDEATSLEKLERAIAGHAVFFDALAALLERGGQLVVTIGNHDLDMAWPAVQARVGQRLGPRSTTRLQFETGGFDYHGVRIQHGHQFTPENCPRDPLRFFHEHDDGAGARPFLERVWGSDFVLQVLNPLEEEYPFADNVKPAVRVLAAGLRHGWVGAAQLAGLAAFLKRRGAPPGLISKVLAEEPDVRSLRSKVSVAHVAASFSDPDWRALAFEIARDKDGRRALEEALASFDAEQLAALTGGSPAELGVGTGAAQQAPGTLGVFRPPPEVRGAHSLVKGGARHVVLGHTHHVVKGDEVGQPDGSRLFNPGTWMRRLHLDDRKVTLDLLRDESLYTYDLEAVMIPASDPDSIALVPIPAS